MNSPLLLTSFALLAGVAARPIDNNRQRDDLRELTRGPESNDRQAFLGRISSDFDTLNSLQLHELHDNTQVDNSALDGSRSPKLNGVDTPSDPDPGLSSPYMGPQRHLSNMEQELGSPAQTFILHPPTPSSPAPRKPEQPQLSLENPDYSPMVVVLVFSSFAALVLLGLAVVVVYTSQLIRRAMFQEDVWRSVAGDPRAEKGNDNTWSEEEKEEQEKQAALEGGMDQGVIAAREIPSKRQSIKPSEGLDQDPDVPSLPDRPSTSSVRAMYNRDHGRNLGLALAAWTYDNWMTHFIMALFGWLGVFFGGARA